MEQQVFEALQGTLSAESSARMEGELALKRLELDTGFSLAAANIALASEAGPAIRQAAMVQIRSYVGRHWSIGSARYEEGPIPDQQIKAQVRQKVFSLLVCDDRKLRIGAAAVVASMAIYDWPDEWPQLFSQLIEMLRHGKVHAQSALRVFSEWVGTDMSDQQLEQVGELLTELHRILSADSGDYTGQTRVMAAKVFGDCIEIIGCMSIAKRDFVDTHAPPILREWMELILGALRRPASAGDTSSIALKTECVKALIKAIVGLPRHLEPYFPAILETLWSQLQELQELYLRAFVYQDGADDDSAISLLVRNEDDDEAYTVDSYLCTIFEWISRASTNKQMRKFFVEKADQAAVAGPTPFLDQLATSLTCYAQITTDTLEDWADDMDLFVADEDEEGYRFNVRVSVQELLQALGMAFPHQLARALGSAARERSELARQWRGEGRDHWWLVSEAVLWAIGTIGSSVFEQPTGSLDLGSLFDSDVWPLAQSPGMPFGQGRAFIFASGLAQALPSDVAAAFVGASANAVSDTQLHPAVRLSAVRAISNFCRHLPAELVKPHQDRFIRGLASVIPQLSEDSAHVALLSLHTTLRVDQGITASLEPVISEVALGVWQRYPGDVLLTGIVIDIVEDMASNTSARDAFSRRALPVIGTAITQADDGMVVSSGIDLLSGVLKGVPSPLPDGYTEAIFPSLIQVLADSKDSEVLHSGQTCLKYFVQKDAQCIAQWRDAQGKSGLERIVDFVAMLMSPDNSESSALFVGDLVTKIVQKCGQHITGDDLAGLVRIVTARLATARTPSLCTSLLPFYAQLMVSHPSEVVDLLSAMSFGSRTGLHVVLSEWFKNYLDIQGYYSRKVSATALMRLFSLADPRVDATMVEGDLLPNSLNSGKIVTRSMSRTHPDQYTQIPAPAKIIKLLLAEMDMDVESLFARGSGGAGLSAVVDEADLGAADADEWEDDGEVDLLGDAKHDYLSGLMGAGFDFEDDLEDDDDNDEEILADPIYNQDLNEALGAFLRQAAQDGQRPFHSAIAPSLTAQERSVMDELCS
ncbi:hypothetical protein GGF46_003027 [Coemansia sp. RSA 552]|nr:hypothetical protein GGF46_003027 [Coemansia sp. RSA 552]